MKIVISGDWHVDAHPIGKIDTETDLDVRIKDFFDAIDYMIDYAIENKIEVFIMNGDLFKRRTSSHLIETRIASRFRKISKHMKLIVNLGNHDYTPKMLSHGLHTYSILSEYDLDFQIYTEISHLALDGVDLVIYPYYDLKRVDFSSNDELVGWIQDEVGKFELKQECKLFVGHGTPQGTLINEDWFLDLDVIDEPILPKSLFEPFDMALFSHIHRRHAISDRVFHIGSPERIDFGEANDDKGFVIYDTTAKKMEWVSTNPRPMSDIKLDLTNLTEFDDPTEKIIDSIVSLPDLSRQMVKLHVKMLPSSYSMIDHRAIQLVLDRLFWYKGPKYEVPKVQKTRIKEVTEQLDDVEALEKVLAAKEELAANERQQILIRGRGILAKAPQTSSE